MKPLALALALAAAVTLFAPRTVAAAAPSLSQIPVAGSVVGGGTFTGTFNLTRFATQNGALVAVGTLSGTLTTAAGQITSIVQTISIPVTAATGTCQILHLELGPLSLTLLGLNVDLSRIVLDITADAGPGNLLGNLLCSVANLLNDPTGLARLLNQILALL
jgi:hypothetical protein